MRAPSPILPGGACDQLLTGIFAVQERRIDQMTALAYRGHLEGAIDEAQLELLTDAARCRREVFAARRRVRGSRPLASILQPDGRNTHREKRRTWSASGALPPALRARFTPGEHAVAAVIRAEVRRHGRCSLPYSAIARSAGLSGTTVVKRFVREARRAGLIDVQARPVPGQRHLPNIITIISVEWRSWNELAPRKGGGGTAVPSHQNIQENKRLRTGRIDKATPRIAGREAVGLGREAPGRSRGGTEPTGEHAALEVRGTTLPGCDTPGDRASKLRAALDRLAVKVNRG